MAALTLLGMTVHLFYYYSFVTSYEYNYDDSMEIGNDPLCSYLEDEGVDGSAQEPAVPPPFNISFNITYEYENLGIGKGRISMYSYLMGYLTD